MTAIIDPQAIAKTANLAKLSDNLSVEFINSFGDDINKVLEYSKLLDEVDVTGINPLDGIRTITLNELREDTEPEDPETYSRIRSNIIANLPSVQNNLLIIPGIFENS